MTAKILAIFPTPAMVPQNAFSTLIRELAESGHEIMIVAANPAFHEYKTRENIIILDYHANVTKIWQKYNSVIVSGQNDDVVSEVALSLQTTIDIFEELLKTYEFKMLIDKKDSYYDLLLLEASVTPLISLSHIFKAPAILVSSIGALLNNYEIVGVPTHPFLYPSIYQRRIYNLTTWEKATEISTYIRLKLKILSHENNVDVILKKHFGSDFPSVNELKRNVFALFLNSNPTWTGNHPVSPNVVFLGGIQPINIEQLPEDYQSFLDKSINGVIYVSFGNNIKLSQLPPRKLLRILNVLSEISYDVLLKWDNNKLPGAPKNVKIFKWLPQSSVLVHPKIKLFITQGGIQSTFESINAGVPMIGIPMYSDQWYNTEKYKHFNIGLQIDLASLTEEILMDKINLVISDESYRSSVAELRAMMYEQTGSSVDRALWWTEQLLRPYGRRYLRAPAANISWAEYLELDFVLSLILVLFVKMLVLIVLLTLIFRYAFKTFVDIRKKVS